MPISVPDVFVHAWIPGQDEVVYPARTSVVRNLSQTAGLCMKFGEAPALTLPPGYALHAPKGRILPAFVILREAQTDAPVILLAGEAAGTAALAPGGPPPPRITRFLPGIVVTVAGDCLSARYQYETDPLVRPLIHAEQNLLALTNPLAISRTIRLLSRDAEIYVGTDPIMTDLMNPARCHILSNVRGKGYADQITLAGGLAIYAKAGNEAVEVSVEEVAFAESCPKNPSLNDFGGPQELVPADWDSITLRAHA